MIARRLRLAFLNVQAAQEALPIIVDIMAEELKWDDKEKEKQIKDANDFLTLEMGLAASKKVKENVPINLSGDEVKLFKKRFAIIDKDSKGYVSVNDIRRALKVISP